MDLINYQLVKSNQNEKSQFINDSLKQENSQQNPLLLKVKENQKKMGNEIAAELQSKIQIYQMNQQIRETIGKRIIKTINIQSKAQQQQQQHQLQQKQQYNFIKKHKRELSNNTVSSKIFPKLELLNNTDSNMANFQQLQLQLQGSQTARQQYYPTSTINMHLMNQTQTHTNKQIKMPRHNKGTSLDQKIYQRILHNNSNDTIQQYQPHMTMSHLKQEPLIGNEKIKTEKQQLAQTVRNSNKDISHMNDAGPNPNPSNNAFYDGSIHVPSLSGRFSNEQLKVLDSLDNIKKNRIKVKAMQMQQQDEQDQKYNSASNKQFQNANDRNSSQNIFMLRPLQDQLERIGKFFAKQSSLDQFSQFFNFMPFDVSKHFHNHSTDEMARQKNKFQPEEVNALQHDDEFVMMDSLLNRYKRGQGAPSLLDRDCKENEGIDVQLQQKIDFYYRSDNDEGDEDLNEAQGKTNKLIQPQELQQLQQQEHEKQNKDNKFTSESDRILDEMLRDLKLQHFDFFSDNPGSKAQLQILQKWLQQSLYSIYICADNQKNPQQKLCLAEEAYRMCLCELVRQITYQNSDQGHMLKEIWNRYFVIINKYQEMVEKTHREKEQSFKNDFLALHQRVKDHIRVQMEKVRQREMKLESAEGSMGQLKQVIAKNREQELVYKSNQSIFAAKVHRLQTELRNEQEVTRKQQQQLEALRKSVPQNFYQHDIRRGVLNENLLTQTSQSTTNNQIVQTEKERQAKLIQEVQLIIDGLGMETVELEAQRRQAYNEKPSIAPNVIVKVKDSEPATIVLHSQACEAKPMLISPDMYVEMACQTDLQILNEKYDAIFSSQDVIEEHLDEQIIKQECLQFGENPAVTNNSNTPVSQMARSNNKQTSRQSQQHNSGGKMHNQLNEHPKWQQLHHKYKMQRIVLNAIDAMKTMLQRTQAGQAVSLQVTPSQMIKMQQQQNVSSNQTNQQQSVLQGSSFNLLEYLVSQQLAKWEAENSQALSLNSEGDNLSPTENDQHSAQDQSQSAKSNKDQQQQPQSQKNEQIQSQQTKKSIMLSRKKSIMLPSKKQVEFNSEINSFPDAGQGQVQDSIAEEDETQKQSTDIYSPNRRPTKSLTNSIVQSTNSQNSQQVSSNVRGGNKLLPQVQNSAQSQQQGIRLSKVYDGSNINFNAKQQHNDSFQSNSINAETTNAMQVKAQMIEQNMGFQMVGLANLLKLESLKNSQKKQYINKLHDLIKELLDFTLVQVKIVLDFIKYANPKEYDTINSQLNAIRAKLPEQADPEFEGRQLSITQAAIRRKRRQKKAEQEGGLLGTVKRHKTVKFNTQCDMTRLLAVDKTTHPGILIADKLHQCGKIKTFKKIMPLKTILKSISAIYDQRIELSAKNHAIQDQELQLFTYNLFLNKYGIEATAQQQFTIFGLSVLCNLNFVRVNLFAKMLQIMPAQNYNLCEINKCFEGQKYLIQVSQTGSNVPFAESDVRRYIPYVRCLEYVRMFTENKGYTGEEVVEIKEALEKLKEDDPRFANRHGIVDIDSFLIILLKKFQVLQQRTKDYVKNAFQATDMDGNGQADVNEFLLLMRYIEPAKYKELGERNLVSLFEQSCDLVVNKTEMRMSFDRFAVLCIDHKLFQDDKQNQFLCIQDDSMLQSQFVQVKEKWPQNKVNLLSRLEQLDGFMDPDELNQWHAMMAELAKRLDQLVAQDEAANEQNDFQKQINKLLIGGEKQNSSTTAPSLQSKFQQISNFNLTIKAEKMTKQKEQQQIQFQQKSSNTNTNATVLPSLSSALPTQEEEVINYEVKPMLITYKVLSMELDRFYELMQENQFENQTYDDDDLNLLNYVVQTQTQNDKNNNGIQLETASQNQNQNQSVVNTQQSDEINQIKAHMQNPSEYMISDDDDEDNPASITLNKEGRQQKQQQPVNSTSKPPPQQQTQKSEAGEGIINNINNNNASFQATENTTPRNIMSQVKGNVTNKKTVTIKISPFSDGTQNADNTPIIIDVVGNDNERPSIKEIQQDDDDDDDDNV